MSGWLYEAAFQFMAPFCHQLPERSWFIAGTQLPLCIRCTTITVGALLAGVYLLCRRPVPRLGVCLIGTAPLVVDIALPALGIYEGTNGLRALTGLGFGFFFLIGGLSWLSMRGGASLPSPSRSS